MSLSAVNKSCLSAVAAIGTSLALILAVVAGIASPAGADTAPPAGLPATVSADALPTVQQNGVIWSEVTVGNTVYAAGSFSQTWPAGTSNTPANDTARANLLAFDITTGALTSFNHVLNAQALAVTASPDGSRIYVGGDFTTVDGVPRRHIAAFDTATGALVPTFAPSITGWVGAMSVSSSGSTIYIGGNFFSINGVARMRLAALTSGGALTSWSPTADDNIVTAMVVTPDQSEVVIGGRFSSLNGRFTPGLGAVTTATGSSVPYAINQRVKDYTPPNAPTGHGSGIESLFTDGRQIYGSGFAYFGGNFEGTFGVNPDTGVINFLNDCHGDTYDVFATGQVLYDVSHEHDCSAIGAFPQPDPHAWHHATAFTNYPTGTNSGPDSFGWNYSGVPDSTLLQWFPDLGIGSYTGQNQAAWSITGNSNYIALGGEFPTVNGHAQQGIVRFAISSLAPNKVGPKSNAAALTPTVSAQSSTSVKVSWTATWDEDNQALTYKVFRDGANTPVYTTTQNSTFWQLPSMSFTDTGLAAGSTHTYVVKAYDPFNNTTSGASTSITLPGGGGGGGGGGGTPTPLATDNFNRTVTNGWGTATTGGAWTTPTSAARLAVNPGTGTMTMPTPATQTTVYLASLSSSSTDTTTAIASDKLAAGNGVYLYVLGRYVSSTLDYRARIRLLPTGKVGIALMAGTSTTLAGETTLPNLTYTPGTKLSVEFQVTGTNPTTLQLKVWPSASAPPASWQLTATDVTVGLQTNGSVGFQTYLSGAATNAPVTASVTSFTVATAG